MKGTLGIAVLISMLAQCIEMSKADYRIQHTMFGQVLFKSKHEVCLLLPPRPVTQSFRELPYLVYNLYLISV